MCRFAASGRFANLPSRGISEGLPTFNCIAPCLSNLSHILSIRYLATLHFTRASDVPYLRL